MHHVSVVSCVGLYYEPQLEKKYRLTCAPIVDSSQPAHMQSNQSLHCLHEEKTLHPWLSKMNPVKIVIRAQLFKTNDAIS